MTARSWEGRYRQGGRKPRHRCVACGRPVADGERVLMWRVPYGTEAMHIGCAEAAYPGAAYRAAVEIWAAA